MRIKLSAMALPDSSPTICHAHDFSRVYPSKAAKTLSCKNAFGLLSASLGRLSTETGHTYLTSLTGRTLPFAVPLHVFFLYLELKPYMVVPFHITDTLDITSLPTDA